MNRGKRMLGDKAFGSTELREELDDQGIKPVIPNRRNGARMAPKVPGESRTSGENGRFA